jgi:hypothetical protein
MALARTDPPASSGTRDEGNALKSAMNGMADLMQPSENARFPVVFTKSPTEDQTVRKYLITKHSNKLSG